MATVLRNGMECLYEFILCYGKFKQSSHSFILLLGAGLLSIVPAANLVPGDIVEVSGYK